MNEKKEKLKDGRIPKMYFTITFHIFSVIHFQRLRNKISVLQRRVKLSLVHLMLPPASSFIQVKQYLENVEYQKTYIPILHGCSVQMPASAVHLPAAILSATMAIPH